MAIVGASPPSMSRTTSEAALVPHVHDIRLVEARVSAAEGDVDQVVGRSHLLVGQELAHGAQRARDDLLESPGCRAGHWRGEFNVDRRPRFGDHLAQLDEAMIERDVREQIQDRDVDT